MLFFPCDEQVGGLNNLTFFDTMAMRIHHSEHFTAPAVNEHDECLRLEPRTNYVTSNDGSFSEDVQPYTCTTSASASCHGLTTRYSFPSLLQLSFDNDKSGLALRFHSRLHEDAGDDVLAW